MLLVGTQGPGWQYWQSAVIVIAEHLLFGDFTFLVHWLHKDSRSDLYPHVVLLANLTSRHL